MPFMRKLPGTLRDGGAPFVTTHWSVVAAAGADDALQSEAQTAISKLCRDYWPPLYSFVRRQGHSPHDAQDLVQGFFGDLLEHRTYTQVDRTKGKFRAFLLTSLKNYLNDEWDRKRRLKRGGDLRFVLLSEEFDAEEAAYAREGQGLLLDGEQLFEQRWAAKLAASAMDRLKAKYATSAKARVFAALKPYMGIAETTEPVSHEQIAAGLGVPVETLRSYLSRMRARYRELLREEVSRTVARAEDVEEEIRHLFRVLVRAN